MRRLTIPFGIVLALVAMSGMASAKDRYTVIHLTKNYHKPAKPEFPGECRATVVTEAVPSQPGDDVYWYIRGGNATSDDDVCPGIDKSTVELHFTDDVFGTAAVKVLHASMVPYKGDASNMVWGVKGTVDPGIKKGTYKYQVFYKGKSAKPVPAGPDPEVEVGCADCGGGRGR